MSFDKIKLDAAELSEVNKNIDAGLKNDYTGKYLGKNIRSNITGLNYYISDRGAVKYFSGPRASLGNIGCPSDWINIDEDLNSETFQKENPYVFTGTDMLSINGEGQTCGAGINVMVDQLPPLETSTVGCYTTSSSSLLGENLNYDQCKNLAAKENYPMFSLNTTILDNGQLYAGNNGTVSGDTYCKGGWGNADFVDKNMDCLYGIDSHGSKIPCSSGGVMMENNSFYCVPILNDNKPSDFGKCYGFKNLANTTSSEKKPIQLKQIPISLTSCTYIDENNTSPIVAYIFSGSGKFGAFLSSYSYAYYWDSSSDCSFGGGINTSLKATYGGNCATQCSIEVGNYTNTLISTIFGFSEPPTKDDITSEVLWDYIVDSRVVPSANFYVATKSYVNSVTGVDTIAPLYDADNDPCLGCSKDFSVTYQCGNNTESTINIPPNADGVAVNLDCSENVLRCTFGIGISDEGDVKILQDIYGSVKELVTICKPCPNKLVPIFSDYNDSSWIKMKDRLALNVEYNGKKYNLLKSPGQFSPSEYILSPAGTCAIVFTNSLPIIIYYEEGISCNTLTGNYLGLDSGSASFYAINQFTTPLFANNYGKRGYVDDDMVLHEYSSELNPTFVQTSNTSITGGNVIGTTDYYSDDQCKVECMKNDCNLISIDNKTCTYYKDVSGFVSSNGKVYEKKAPASTVSDTCPFQDYTNITTTMWENYAKSATPMTSETSCYTEKNNYLSSQINRANDLSADMSNELETQAAETNSYIESRENINATVTSNLAKIKNFKEGFADIFITSDMKNINTMYDQTFFLKTYNTSQLILWSVVSIIIIIMIIYQ